MASTTMQGNAYMPKYAAELIANARKLVTPGKGILAADESTGTIGKRVRWCAVHWRTSDRGWAAAR
jgi:Fructose-bisphosphate aldolase class-I